MRFRCPDHRGQSVPQLYHNGHIPASTRVLYSLPPLLITTLVWRHSSMMSFVQALFGLLLHPGPLRRQPAGKPSGFAVPEPPQGAHFPRVHLYHLSKTLVRPTIVASKDITTPESRFEHAERFYGMSMLVAKALGIRARLGFVYRRAIAQPTVMHKYVPQCVSPVVYLILIPRSTRY